MNVDLMLGYGVPTQEMTITKKIKEAVKNGRKSERSSI